MVVWAAKASLTILCKAFQAQPFQVRAKTRLWILVVKVEAVQARLLTAFAMV